MPDITVKIVVDDSKKLVALETLALQLYQAYANEMDARDSAGRKMIAWEQLPHDEQYAWLAVAQGAQGLCVSVHTTTMPSPPSQTDAYAVTRLVTDAIHRGQIGLPYRPIRE